MTIHLYNTLTKKKETFEPIDPQHVKMYVCGPTVYDRAHIGNARPVVVFDTLYRLLTSCFEKVTYARNITDVDDKINKAAFERKVTIQDITKVTTQYYHDDMAALNALFPTIEPKATEHIDEMVMMIQQLIDHGHAYIEEEHVLFDVTSWDEYGKLSNRTLDDMIAGSRVEVESYKKNPGDFVLWKPSDDTQPGWPSPWGRGRPGWHIECSAMSTKYLGETFDIHGGGEDLVFPHHENEIAQSECALKKKFVHYWMHNAYVLVDNEKMSKSLGNFFTVEDVLKKFPGEVIRAVLLNTHYRQSLNFTAEACQEAKNILDRLYTALRDNYSLYKEELNIATELDDDVTAALKDDLNTPLAFRQLSHICNDINKESDEKTKIKKLCSLVHSARLLGVLYQEPNEWFQAALGEETLGAVEIEKLIAERNQARQDKNFSEADRIRDLLKQQGITLEDKAGETIWKRS